MRGVFERPKGSRIWWINWYDQDGRRHREKVGREAVARRAYIERQISAREGKFVQPRASGTSFGELAAARMEDRRPHIRARSYRTDELRLKALVATFGDLPARALDAQRIQDWLTAFREGGTQSTTGTKTKKPRSGATANRYRTLLSSIYSYGLRARLVAANPVRQVQPFKESEGRVRYLSIEEERALRKVIRRNCRHHEAEFDLALQTGIRRGEQFGLRWEHVDLRSGTIAVSGKTGRRFVNVSVAAERALKTLKRQAVAGSSEFVCPDRSAERQSDWRRWFEIAVREAGVANFRWHDMRHTFASRLVMAGVDLRTVQELMGHRNIQTTMRYAHLSQPHKRQALELLSHWHQNGTKRRRRGRRIVQIA